MAKLDIEPVAARHSVPVGASYAPGYGGGSQVDEYVFDDELGDWRWVGAGQTQPDDSEPESEPERPKDCPIVKKNGHPCSGNPTSTGFCVGHSQKVGAILGRILAGEQ